MIDPKVLASDKAFVNFEVIQPGIFENSPPQVVTSVVQVYAPALIQKWEQFTPLAQYCTALEKEYNDLKRACHHAVGEMQKSSQTFHAIQEDFQTLLNGANALAKENEELRNLVYLFLKELDSE